MATVAGGDGLSNKWMTSKRRSIERLGSPGLCLGVFAVGGEWIRAKRLVGGECTAVMMVTNHLRKGQ
jgi:hypothetical protein